MDILVIPDVHCTPGVTNDHLCALGELVCVRRPDVIACLGDFADVESLCSHNANLEQEGLRVEADYEATKAGLRALFSPIRKLQSGQRFHRRKIYRPESFITLGNHEQRVIRAIKKHPELEGVLSMEGFGYEDWFDTVLPFRQPCTVGGVSFVHYLSSGSLGRAVGHPNLAAKLVIKSHQSTVVGHDHGLDYSTGYRPDGSRFFGLSAGHYSAPDWDASYLPASERARWVAAVVLLKDVVDGWPRGGYEVITQERILEGKYD